MTAWIEIRQYVNKRQSDCVAVFMTAWIEIYCLQALKRKLFVAVFMTAWIEIGIWGIIKETARLQSS